MSPGEALLRESIRERERGHAERAHELVSRALALDPGYFEALVHRGVLAAELGRPAEALASYDAALRLRPSAAQALYNRGTALQALGRHAEATESYQRLLQQTPADAEALNNLGVCLLETGRAAEARALADSAITEAERIDGIGFAEVRLRVAAAEARHAAGDGDGARAVLRSALDHIAARADRITDPAWRASYLG
ncbi:MAG TPA: tetratricopeptide repeat protein, partial [Burkholderiales bacterium]|nr:tetratricopeptide repeat protein [Burkholderiales bacterium]